MTRDGAAASSGCPSSASPGTQTSCTDTGVSLATHKYTVTAVWHSWTATSTSASAQVTTGPATHLLLAPATTTPTAGAADNLTITAQDANNNTVTTYAGAKSLKFAGAAASGTFNPSVTDSAGTATSFGTPETINFTSGVASASGASNGVMTLYKAETAKITVSDGTLNNGAGLSVTVAPAAASKFTLPTPSTQTAGAAFSETLTAKDLYGNTATGYTGSQTITFTGPASSPERESARLTAAGDLQRRREAPTGSITLYNASAATTLTATQSGVSGTSASFVVNPAGASSFTLAAPSTQTAGAPFNETLTAKDLYGNTATGYTGSQTITFTGPASSPER